MGVPDDGSSDSPSFLPEGTLFRFRVPRSGCSLNRKGLIPLWVAVVLGLLAFGALVENGKYSQDDWAKDALNAGVSQVRNRDWKDWRVRPDAD